MSNWTKETKRLKQEADIQAEAHNYMTNFWTNVHLYIGLPTTILSALVSILVLSTFLNNEIITGVISILVTCLTASITFLNPTEKSNLHRTAKQGYKILSYKILINDSEENIKNLFEDSKDLIKNSPQFPYWVHKIAEKRAQKKNNYDL